MICHSDMRKVVLYYKCELEEVRKIEQHFGLPRGITINGETCQPVEIKDEDWEMLKETERRGFIQIRKIIEEK